MFVLKNIDRQEYMAAFLSRKAAVCLARKCEAEGTNVCLALKCEAEGMNVCLEFMTDIF